MRDIVVLCCCFMRKLIRGRGRKREKEGERGRKREKEGGADVSWFLDNRRREERKRREGRIRC